MREVSRHLETTLIGREIHYFQEISSTNDYAKSLALNDAAEGVIVIAETQRQGRGRGGRRWVSPKGGLWFSIILRPLVDTTRIFQITFLIAVSIVKTLKQVYNLPAQIKWPNDVLINQRKVGGILTEIVSHSNQIEVVIAGIGINVNVALDKFPIAIKHQTTSIMHELNKECDTARFFKSLIEQIEHEYLCFLAGNFTHILADWKTYNSILGEHVRVMTSEGLLEGNAIDLDETGALLIKCADGTIVPTVSGDVSILKED